jgi:hypothetical protein
MQKGYFCMHFTYFQDSKNMRVVCRADRLVQLYKLPESHIAATGIWGRASHDRPSTCQCKFFTLDPFLKALSSRSWDRLSIYHCVELTCIAFNYGSVTGSAS